MAFREWHNLYKCLIFSRLRVGRRGDISPILGLARLNRASVYRDRSCGTGRELLGLKEAEWRNLRGKEIAYVPQSPMSSLNPALRIGTQLSEAWKLQYFVLFA